MAEKLDFLKTKIEEVQNIFKQQQSAYKELINNINVAEENKKTLNENILKLQGVIEGLQFSVTQLEEASKSKQELEEKKKGK